MGALNFKAVKLKQGNDNADNARDKQLIQQLKEKIETLAKDQQQAKKMAQIISGLINAKK